MATDIRVKEAKKVLAQHAQLAKELASAHASEHESRADLRRSQVAIERSNEARMRLYGQKARGVLKSFEDLNNAELAWHAARRDEISHKGQMEAAANAVTAVQNEIAALYEQHLDVFTEQAERHTQAAIKALEALQAPYTAAWQAYHRAMQAWQPLRGAIAEAVITANLEDGKWRDRTVVGNSADVPALPLPQPGFLSGIPAPRPPAMQPVAPVEASENTAA